MCLIKSQIVLRENYCVRVCVHVCVCECKIENMSGMRDNSSLEEVERIMEFHQNSLSFQSDSDTQTSVLNHIYCHSVLYSLSVTDCYPLIIFSYSVIPFHFFLIFAYSVSKSSPVYISIKLICVC